MKPRMLSLLLLALASFPAAADRLPILEPFDVSGTQYTLLAKSFWERAVQSAGFNRCVRRLYSKPELLDNPLPIDAYGILAFFQKSRTAHERNTFSILNSSDEKWLCAMDFGYCMGVSSLARDLNLLLIFDPKESLNPLPKFANNQAKSGYFEDLIYTAWAAKKPVVIPGYSDLHAFSADPVIRHIFLGAIPKNWGDLASIPDIAIDVAGKSRRLISNAEMIKEIEYLKAANEKGYNPLIHLGGVDGQEPHGAAQLAPGSGRPDPTSTGMDIAPSEKEIAELMAGVARKHGGPRGSEATGAHGKAGDAIGAIKDSDHTYIHVVQVTKVEEAGPRKWIISVTDPNAKAPHNVGRVTVDLDSKTKIYFQGATASLGLNAFGQLPGDREHVDEIVANITAFAEKHPEIFTKTAIRRKR